MNTIATENLKNALTDKHTHIIDIRPVEAYNGWQLEGEKRSGHIQSARSLPFKWATYLDWLDIVQSKGIQPENKIIVYGYDEEKTEKVARRFSRAGYDKVQVYYNFVKDWSANPELPMERLSRYQHLVSAEWLNHLMQKSTAPEFDNSNFVICHVHYQNRDAYDQGHIPGAIEVDTNSLESPVTWNRRSPEEVKDVLQNLGITHDTTVILYGRFSFPDNDDPFPGSSAGHLGSIRCAFIMMWAGVKDVRVLNGGLQSWEDAGFNTVTEETPKTPVSDFGTTIPQQSSFAVDTPEAKEIIASNDSNLVSVRSWREYIGEVSGYNYIKKTGRIPGSVFGNCGSDAYHMENYRNLDHTTREYHEIQQLWEEVGVTSDKHNAFYCGTGWRGSEAFFNAWLMGWPRVSVFDGGWLEWSNDPENPIEVGIPDK